MVPGACFKGALAGSLLLLVAGCMSPAGDTVAEMRAEARRMRTLTLTKLYRIHPGAKRQIAKAQGYGVFSNIGLKLFVVSAGNGWGILRDHKTGQDTYMKMVSAGLGLGLGVKDFRGVFVFTTRRALRGFVEDGWDASAEADAAFKSGKKGVAYAGAIDVAPGIKLYQITEHGLSLQATIQGTRYWVNDEIN